MAARGERQPCRFFLSGNCKYGQACTFSHAAAPAGEGEYVMDYDEALYMHQQQVMMQQQMLMYQQQQQQQQQYFPGPGQSSSPQNQ